MNGIKTTVEAFRPFFEFFTVTYLFPYDISYNENTWLDFGNSTFKIRSIKKISEISFQIFGISYWIHLGLLGLYILQSGFGVVQLVRSCLTSPVPYPAGAIVGLGCVVLISICGIIIILTFEFKNGGICHFVNQWRQVESEILKSKHKIKSFIEIHRNLLIFGALYTS